MTSRMSKGCLRCRTRRVKCDEGRPACQRCLKRNEICTGYRSESTLIFHNENEKTAHRTVRRRATFESLLTPGGSTPSIPSSSSGRSRRDSTSVDPSDLSHSDIAGLTLGNPFPWAKSVPDAVAPSVEDQAVSKFFENYVMYPCNDGSSPGFLQHLPVLFSEVNIQGRLALRWAVRAAAYANLSNEQDSVDLGKKALECYGLALSALAEALADTRVPPDDYTLMTVVVLDLFEAIFIHDTSSHGSHAQGMAQILRLRGPDQIYGARGWSLFQLSHHRLQRQQLTSKLSPLTESEAWLGSLNDSLPDIRLEKDNFEIIKICARARELLKSINGTELSAAKTLDIVKEMHDLERTSNGWRDTPGWAFKTVNRNEIMGDPELTSTFPEVIQLHRDVWLAYEWNYHRTSTIIMHEQLLDCLNRLQSFTPADQEWLLADIFSLQYASTTKIQVLVDDILSTVPQSLGDIDHDGNMVQRAPGAYQYNGVGGYFLLWPIHVSKKTNYATVQQRAEAQRHFDRIRECTRMKTELGEASNI